MGTAHLRQGRGPMLEQVKPVRDLNRRGRALACAICIGFGAVSRDDLHARVAAEPLCEGVGVAITEERDRPASLQVHQDRAIRVTFPEAQSSTPRTVGVATPWQRQTAHHAQKGVPAHRSGPSVWLKRTPALPPRATPSATRRWTRRGVRRAQGAATGQAFGEDAARAAPVGAEELPDPELSHDAEVCPREIREGALIVTVDASRGKPAHGTVPQGLYRGDAQGQLGCHLVQMPRLQV